MKPQDGLAAADMRGPPAGPTATERASAPQRFGNCHALAYRGLVKPLTHHEILALIGPFTRRGRHVDLAASNRLERRLEFKPVELPGLRETLVLEDAGVGVHRLTRELALPSGLTARLVALGNDPGDLLARIESIAPQRQIHAGTGFMLATSHRLHGDDPATQLVFQRADAEVGGLTVRLEAGTVTRGRAPVTLIPSPGEAIPLPEDALAVLGRQWTRIKATAEGWAGYFEVRGGEPRRTANAEASLKAAAAHLALMLTESPARFHERWWLARWRVFFRRLIPVGVLAGLLLGAAAVPRLHLAQASGLRMLILNSPPLLLIFFFCLREVPIIEIPPLPRRPAAAAWRTREAALP